MASRNIVRPSSHGRSGGPDASEAVRRSEVVRKWARSFASTFGWKVFPVYGAVNGRCACPKFLKNEICDRPGKHPLTHHGYKEATSDKKRINRWWTDSPHANIAVATGAASGIVVLDIDRDKGGHETLKRLAEEHGGLPRTPRVETGNGWHLYFRHPDMKVNSSVGRTNTGLGEGLDVRADGGYVVAPPSIHVSGRVYRWSKGRSPNDLPLADLPPWLLDLLQGRAPKVRRAARDAEQSRRATLSAKATKGPARSESDRRRKFVWTEVLNGVPEGRRNISIFHMACSLHGRGTPGAVIEELARYAAQHCQPPLPEDEALRAARSAYRYLTNAERRKSGAISEERLEILHELHRAERPLAPREIAVLLSQPRDRTRGLLAKMHKDGQVRRENGMYRSNFNEYLRALETAYLALQAPVNAVPAGR